MSTSPAIAGCQFELNRPLSDSAQRLSDSANSACPVKCGAYFSGVRDKQDPFRVTPQATTSRGKCYIIDFFAIFLLTYEKQYVQFMNTWYRSKFERIPRRIKLKSNSLNLANWNIQM